MDDNSAYNARKARLQSSLERRAAGGYALGKRTASNLYRYTLTGQTEGKRLDLTDFNHVLGLDQAQLTLDVEGLTTFEQMVDSSLPHGLLPCVTPELKHITIGGAIAGIGIESSGFRHGFVHDMLLAAEVLLPDGEIVYCDPQNRYADLFHALPNSYGTLAYILRVKIQLMPAQPFVAVRIRACSDLRALIDGMYAAAQAKDIDFVEALLFAPDRGYLMLGSFAGRLERADDIVRRHIFYKLVQQRELIQLRTRDYLFRYDPDWFWNLPETRFYSLFRRYASMRFRNSGFYYRYTEWLQKLRTVAGLAADDRTEPLIQDWEVPWAEGLEFTRFAQREVDLQGKPWLVTPIRSHTTATLYPVQSDTLYYNLGSYCRVRRPPQQQPYRYSRLLDKECYRRGGIKMLYSSSFLSAEEFDRRYNGVEYRKLKQKYDPQGKLPSLYDLSRMEDGDGTV